MHTLLRQVMFVRNVHQILIIDSSIVLSLQIPEIFLSVMFLEYFSDFIPKEQSLEICPHINTQDIELSAHKRTGYRVVRTYSQFIELSAHKRTGYRAVRT